LPYKVVVRYKDREETVEQFDFLDEVLDYLSTHMGHVFGRKDVIGILILKRRLNQTQGIGAPELLFSQLLLMLIIAIQGFSGLAVPGEEAHLEP
jgi:hypothetical protein